MKSSRLITIVCTQCLLHTTVSAAILQNEIFNDSQKQHISDTIQQFSSSLPIADRGPFESLRDNLHTQSHPAIFKAFIQLRTQYLTKTKTQQTDNSNESRLTSKKSLSYQRYITPLQQQYNQSIIRIEPELRSFINLEFDKAFPISPEPIQDPAVCRTLRANYENLNTRLKILNHLQSQKPFHSYERKTEKIIKKIKKREKKLLGRIQDQDIAEKLKETQTETTGFLAQFKRAFARNIAGFTGSTPTLSSMVERKYIILEGHLEHFKNAEGLQELFLKKDLTSFEKDFIQYIENVDAHILAAQHNQSPAHHLNHSAFKSHIYKLRSFYKELDCEWIHIQNLTEQYTSFIESHDNVHDMTIQNLKILEDLQCLAIVASDSNIQNQFHANLKKAKEHFIDLDNVEHNWDEIISELISQRQNLRIKIKHLNDLVDQETLMSFIDIAPDISHKTFNTPFALRHIVFINESSLTQNINQHIEKIENMLSKQTQLTNLIEACDTCSSFFDSFTQHLKTQELKFVPEGNLGQWTSYVKDSFKNESFDQHLASAHDQDRVRKIINFCDGQFGSKFTQRKLEKAIKKFPNYSLNRQKKKESKYTGLFNQGNTCYLNCALKGIAFSHLTKALHETNPQGDTATLLNLLKKIQSPNETSSSPEIKQLLTSLTTTLLPHLTGFGNEIHNMQDADQCFRTVVERLGLQDIPGVYYSIPLGVKHPKLITNLKVYKDESGSRLLPNEKPQTLVIFQGRYRYDNSLTKDDSLVDFPSKLFFLDVENPKKTHVYSLKFCVSHHGSTMDTGHYTGMSFHHLKNNYHQPVDIYQHNDSIVNLASPGDLIRAQHNAVFLIYDFDNTRLSN